MSVKIGIVCEGITDYTILKHITECYLRDWDVYVVPLKPRVTPLGIQDGFGSWTGVLDYISGADGMLFEAVHEGCDYVIVQIDTDVCDQYGVGKNHKTDSQLHMEVMQRLLSLTHPDFDPSKLLFAITIEETECWLLPFLTTNPKISCRTTGCVNVLNRLHKGGEYIDPHNKNAPGARKVYINALRQKRKAKELKAISLYNFGFKWFIDSLDGIKHVL